MRLLKELRKKAKISQSKVADTLGYGSPQYISNVERGASFPNPKMVEVMANLYGVSYQDLAREVVNAIVEKHKKSTLKYYKIK